jgi:hypothetical protein
MVMFSPFAPAVDYLRAALAARLAAARAKEDGERGASVVEWVVITTIVVVIAITVGVWISGALTTQGKNIQNCINTAGSGNQGACPNGGN